MKHKYLSCNCKWRFDSTACNSNQKWNNETCQCECKSYQTCREDCGWNPSTCFCANGKYLKVLLMIQKLCVMKLQMS